MTLIDEAQARARRLYPRSRAMRNVYLRGVRAALAGKPISVCPYPVTHDGTYRQAWRLAWTGGYHSVPPQHVEG